MQTGVLLGKTVLGVGFWLLRGLGGTCARRGGLRSGVQDGDGTVLFVTRKINWRVYRVIGGSDFF